MDTYINQEQKLRNLIQNLTGYISDFNSTTFDNYDRQCLNFIVKFDEIIQKLPANYASEENRPSQELSNLIKEGLTEIAHIRKIISWKFTRTTGASWEEICDFLEGKAA